MAGGFAPVIVAGMGVNAEITVFVLSHCLHGLQLCMIVCSASTIMLFYMLDIMMWGAMLM